MSEDGGAEQFAEVERWTLPAMEGRVVDARRDRVTAADLEGIERAAWDEGHARGREEGLAAGAEETRRRVAEIDKRIGKLDRMLETLARPLVELDSEVERQLLVLAMTVARHVVRRELRSDPAQIIGILRDTLALLPAATRDVRVHLHPEDAALVNETLAGSTTERAWVLVEDPVMARGGCRVAAQHSNIDARVEARLNDAIAQLLGDERTTLDRGAE